jgi:hypothetical protein
MTKQQKQFKLLLAFILLTGLVLRFWKFWEIPFMFDELSAMSRTTFDNFTDLIKYGVVERDTHPAGVQVFMYYWVMLFGEREIVVKLPFMIAGFASIYIAYLIGKLWFNRTTGILTATLMSSLQFFIMYSQIARPYASGLLLTLMMVLFWSKYFFKKNKIIYLALFVLFAALSAYNHYFSLLFAAIVGFSGLLFVKRETRTPYIIGGFAIALLYVPHLGIFFSQLEKGGVGGWLQAPESSFLFQFLNYLFHFSFWVYGIFILVYFALLFFKVEKTETNFGIKKRIVLAIWFFLPLIIGYVYSVKVEPILQYSLLLFSTPYLFILLFSFLKETSFRMLSFAVAILLLANIVSLVFYRQHYKIFYKQPSDEIVKQAVELEKSHPGNVFFITNTIPYYNEYYFRKYDKVLPYYTVRNKELGVLDFEKMVSEIEENVVVTSEVNGNTFEIVNKYFPYWKGEEKGFTYENYVFSKMLPEDGILMKKKLVAFTNFDTVIGNWDARNGHWIVDSVSSETVFEVQADKEWTFSGLFPLSEMTETAYVIFDIEAELQMDKAEDDAMLVASLVKDGKTIGFRAFRVKDFINPENLNCKLLISIDVQTLLGNNMDIKDVKLKTFVWNKEFKHFYINNYTVSLREGNPFRYALYYDFSE